MMKTSKAGSGAVKGKLLNTLMLAALTLPGVAMAEEASPFSANVSLVTDYLYRGISQTGAKPAIQGGFDYAHASGFYAGVWGSNISWISDAGVATNASVELDTYLGFGGSFAEDFTYDVGFLRYNYPGTYAAGATRADTDEIYGAIGYKWVSAKYSYSLGKTFGVPDAQGSNYFEINADFPLAEGFSLGAHAGKQTYKGSSAAYVAAGGPTATYTDYKLGVTKELGSFELGLAYSKTNAQSGGFYTNLQGKDLGKGTVVLSLSSSF